MITHGALGKRSADVTRRILTPVANDNDCLNFIIENREYFKKIINAAEDDASDFKDIIRQKVELNLDLEHLEEFSKSIGIIKETNK